MRIAPILLACAATLLTACAPGHLSQFEAQTALQARMERPGDRKVEVVKIHEFQITDCADAVGDDGLVCTVQMDVAFTVDDQPQRDKAAEKMRFVFEGGRWVAYPGG